MIFPRSPSENGHKYRILSGDSYFSNKSFSSLQCHMDTKSLCKWNYLLNLGVSKMLLPIARNIYLCHPHPYIIFLHSLKPWRNIFSLLRWMIQPKNLMLVNIMIDILGFLTQFPIYVILLKWVDLGTWEILVICNRRACNAPLRSSKFPRSSPSSILRIPCQYTIYSILKSI